MLRDLSRDPIFPRWDALLLPHDGEALHQLSGRLRVDAATHTTHISGMWLQRMQWAAK